MDTATDWDVKASVALTYVPCILLKLDADSREMFAQVMQATLHIGYENGFNDATAQKNFPAKGSK